MKRLGDILVDLGLVDTGGVAAALARRQQLGSGRIGEHLVALGLIDEEGLLRGLARQFHVPFADETLFQNMDRRLWRLVPRSKALHYQIVPVRYIDGYLIVATCEASNLERRSELVDALGQRVRLVLSSRANLDLAIEQVYPANEQVRGEVESPPIPARQRRQESRQTDQRGGLGPLDLAAVPSERGEPTVKVELPIPDAARATEQRIARELEAELPHSSGAFQLTQEVLGKLRRGNPTEATGALTIETTTPVVLDESKTILDHEIARRIRAELGKELPSRPRTPDQVQRVQTIVGRAPLPTDSVDDPGRRSLVIRDQATLRDGQVTLDRAEPTSSASRRHGTAALDDEFADRTMPGVEDTQVTIEVSQTEFTSPLVVPESTATERMAAAASPGEGGLEVAGAEEEGEVFGNYLLLRRIKSGGMAEVFEARTRGVAGVARRVAIKRILPNLTNSEEFVTMFIDEAKITVQLNHAAIAQVFELGKVDDVYYIAMEYIDGCDANALAAMAASKGQQVPLPVALYVAQQICEGLDYAHRRSDLSGKSLQIVHRDVSPANVLCSFEGAVKIIDFGIAKAVSKVSLTRPGLIKGKISYMSPEQMRGRQVDHRSDIFALGIVCYELLAGRRLFAGETDVETIRNVLRARVPPLQRVRPDVPEWVAQVVQQALVRDPGQRPQWASEMGQVFHRALLQGGHPHGRHVLAEYLRLHFAGDRAEDT